MAGNRSPGALTPHWTAPREPPYNRVMVEEFPGPLDSAALTALLRRHDIGVTRQRIAVAQVLFERRQHLCAEAVLARARARNARVSRATVYNTLKLFVDHGLLSEVIVDPSRIFFDTEIRPHYHVFDASTGKLADIPAEGIEVKGLPPLPAGTLIDRVDIVIRTRPAPREAGPGAVAGA